VKENWCAGSIICSFYISHTVAVSPESFFFNCIACTFGKILPPGSMIWSGSQRNEYSTMLPTVLLINAALSRCTASELCHVSAFHSMLSTYAVENYVDGSVVF
jgi:hypothetical protein